MPVIPMATDLQNSHIPAMNTAFLGGSGVYLGMLA
jgi:hypothetical protein